MKNTTHVPFVQHTHQATGVIVYRDARPGSKTYLCRWGYAPVPYFWSTADLAQHLKKYAKTLQLSRLAGREPNGGNIITDKLFYGVEPTVEVVNQLAIAARDERWPR